MARIAYTALFLNFTLDATDTPTITNVSNLITNYYQQAYEEVYGVGNYDSTDSDTTDPQTIIRSKEFEGLLIAEISRKVQQWHDSGINSNGEVNPMPSFTISKELATKLRRMSGKTHGLLSSIRLWGHDYDAGDMI